jgi:hypothetical protein
MKNNLIAVGAAALALGLSGVANAATPCAFTAPAEFIHPAKAAKLTGALVQTYVSCNNVGGAVANTETQTGTPACFPAETIARFNALGGPIAPGTWTWGPKSQGSVSFKAGKNKITGGINNTLTPDQLADARDLFIAVKMSDIQDEEGSVIDGGAPARFNSLARTTLIDRAEGKIMTVFDFPTGFDLDASGGKVNKKTSATELINILGQPALPRCTTIELVDVFVRDPNGNTFARLGTFLP